jgi:hypothetical protein
MSLPDAAARGIESTMRALSGAPIAISMLILNISFLAFCGYMLGQVAGNSAERNKSQIELISKLVSDIRDCRQGPRT